MDLQKERNERLFYKVLIEHEEELLPIVYTPVVGEACQKYDNIFRRPHGMYITLKDRGQMLDLLKNWHEKNVEVIVVTEGKRILGLDDLGLNEYDDLLDEFMMACKQVYGEKVLIQFEDFANHNAFWLLLKYGTIHLVFNDDIQGTTVVILAGLIAALPIIGGTLADHKFLFLDAGEVLQKSLPWRYQGWEKNNLEEVRKSIPFVDSKGLVTNARYESLQEFKRPWAHDHPLAHDLFSAVKALKPTVLIGTSGKGGTFTKEVLEEISSYQDKSVIMALSNPTSQSECIAEEAYKYTKGKCIFASGSPFGPMTYEGKTYVVGQIHFSDHTKKSMCIKDLFAPFNNCYIYPGVGLGYTIFGAICVYDDMFLVAAEALAKQINDKHLAKNQQYPAFVKTRKISALIGAVVASKAYELGLATRFPQPKDLFAYAKSCMYSPSYRK